MRYLFLVFLLLAACWTGPSKYELATAQYNRTAMISVACGSMGFGTGVVIGDDYILTARHVVKNCIKDGGLILVTAFGTEFDGIAMVVAEDKDADIARLYVPGIRGPYVEIGPRPIAGDIVCFTPAFPNRHRVCGEVFSEAGDVGDEIRFSGIPQPGNSGSGLYDRRGRLVGIVTVVIFCGNGQYCSGGASLINNRPRE